MQGHLKYIEFQEISTWQVMHSVMLFTCWNKKELTSITHTKSTMCHLETREILTISKGNSQICIWIIQWMEFQKNLNTLTMVLRPRASNRCSILLLYLVISRKEWENIMFTNWYKTTRLPMMRKKLTAKAFWCLTLNFHQLQKTLLKTSKPSLISWLVFVLLSVEFIQLLVLSIQLFIDLLVTFSKIELENLHEHLILVCIKKWPICSI